MLPIDIRWLSVGKATVRLFELSSECYEVIMERVEAGVKGARELIDVVDSDEFWLGIAYMADVFTILNISCVGMQGKTMNRFMVNSFFTISTHTCIKT